VNGNGISDFPQDLFRILAGLIRDKSGIDFGDSNRFLLESRIGSRIRELRLDGPRAYLDHLRYGSQAEAEMDALLDRVTNPETYFFREPEQLSAFTEEILPEWESSAPEGRPLRLWSAGCATGEEPFTLAMLLAEKNFYDRHPVDIFGSDLSAGSVARARSGIYRENSFRQTSEERKSRFFVAEGHGRFRIAEEIRDRVSFGRINLIDTRKLAALPQYDVIFCRNVLIYLDDLSKRNVVASLHQQLVPGGHLFLGRVESLVAFATEFHLRHLQHDMVYQK
jgi:chemotaxis protein methyltransferase CheR